MCGRRPRGGSSVQDAWGFLKEEKREICLAYSVLIKMSTPNANAESGMGAAHGNSSNSSLHRYMGVWNLVSFLDHPRDSSKKEEDTGKEEAENKVSDWLLKLCL